jgi:hypothetical protein
MKWLALTVGLLCASAALVAGIYLRDRDPSNWLPPPRTAASLDAQTILLATHCPAGICSYRLVSNPRPNHWVVRIQNESTTQCFDIDLAAFDVAATRGFTGVTQVGCRSTSAGSDG